MEYPGLPLNQNEFLLLLRFADPKNDLAFKKIFGNENKKEILISFLNAILDFKAGRIIKDVALANPYQIPKIPELKETNHTGHQSH